MLAKCYWKMYTTDVSKLDNTDQDARITANTVLGAIKKSVEAAYNARKSRKSEPILEPHYKIVSIVHKMVMRGDLPAKEAASILAEQPFGVPVKDDDHFASFSEPEDWEEYIIGNLTKLADKDKSNWQHRIIMRHAGIVFNESTAQGEEEGDVVAAAKAAFNILTDSMLTKTMVMNVWKCEAERPGRHHVYTERYTRFVVRLLYIMSDRVNMEQLLKRIRKKGADFYHFLDLWQWCCHEFVKLSRKIYQIPEATEEVFKSMSIEEFDIITGRITDWAGSDGPYTAAFSCMRDVIDLKKLNGGLTRAGPIDDLINDCYSKIYQDVGDSLPGVEPAKLIEESKKAKETAEAEAPAEGDKGPSNPLQNLLQPAEGQDSLRTTPTPQESEKPETGTRARKTGIRRPDVLRKAEQAVMRSMEPKVGVAKSRLGSMSSKRGSQTPVAAASDDGSDEGADAQIQREAQEGGDTKMKDHESEGQDAMHGSDDESLHENDGDDESDLSDAPEGSDEEMPPGLMFPNLHRDEDATEASGDDADSENNGDEQGGDADDTDEVTVDDQAKGDTTIEVALDDQARGDTTIAEEDEEEEDEEEEEREEAEEEEADEEEAEEEEEEGVVVGEEEAEEEDEADDVAEHDGEDEHEDEEGHGEESEEGQEEDDEEEEGNQEHDEEDEEDDNDDTEMADVEEQADGVEMDAEMEGA